MPSGTPHSDDTRAAVMAALLAGQAVGEVAKQYHLSRTTVQMWAASLKATPLQAPQGTDFGALVAAYLEHSLVTANALLEHFRDKAWLRRQSAADLAVLFGITSDKAFRLIAALEPNEPEDDGAADPGETALPD